MATAQPIPTINPPHGILQDAGELIVVSDSTGNTRHRYALVISFSTEEELRRAIDYHICSYRESQIIQEARHG